MKENKNLTAEYIKKIVERNSGVNNIALMSRDRDLSDIRHVYFALCYKYRKTPKPPITFKKSAKAVNRVNHLTARHGKDSFLERRYQNNYKHNLKIYRNCVREINHDLKHVLTSGDRYLKVLKTEDQHRIRFIEHTNKRQKLVANFVSKINDLLGKIDYLESVNKSLLSGLEVDCLTVKHTS